MNLPQGMWGTKRPQDLMCHEPLGCSVKKERFGDKEQDVHTAGLLNKFWTCILQQQLRNTWRQEEYEVLT